MKHKAKPQDWNLPQMQTQLSSAFQDVGPEVGVSPRYSLPEINQTGMFAEKRKQEQFFKKWNNTDITFYIVCVIHIQFIPAALGNYFM